MKKYIEQRPWGKFERLTFNEKSTVKILTIKPGEELSLQCHKKREEFWRVISGEAEFVIGKEKMTGKEADEFFIPKKTAHQIRAGKGEVKVLEISLGKFEEKDIIRLEDKYNRR